MLKSNCILNHAIAEIHTLHRRGRWHSAIRIRLDIIFYWVRIHFLGLRESPQSGFVIKAHGTEAQYKSCPFANCSWTSLSVFYL